MNPIKAIFWNSAEKRIPALWRIVLLILFAGIFASIIAIIADNFSEILEKSILNFLIMLAILGAIYLVGRYIDKRDWADFGITIIPIKQFLYGALLGTLLVSIIFAVQYFLGWLKLEEIRFNKFSTYAFGLVFLGQVFRYLCGSVLKRHLVVDIY